MFLLISFHPEVVAHPLRPIFPCSQHHKTHTRGEFFSRSEHSRWPFIWIWGIASRSFRERKLVTTVGFSTSSALAKIESHSRNITNTDRARTLDWFCFWFWFCGSDRFRSERSRDPTKNIRHSMNGRRLSVGCRIVSDGDTSPSKSLFLHFSSSADALFGSVKIYFTHARSERSKSVAFCSVPPKYTGPDRLVFGVNQEVAGKLTYFFKGT